VSNLAHEKFGKDLSDATAKGGPEFQGILKRAQEHDAAALGKLAGTLHPQEVDSSMRRLGAALGRIEELRVGLAAVRSKAQMVNTGHGTLHHWPTDKREPLVEIPTPKAFVIAAYRREIKEAQERAFTLIASLNAHIEVEL